MNAVGIDCAREIDEVVHDQRRSAFTAQRLERGCLLEPQIGRGDLVAVLDHRRATRDRCGHVTHERCRVFRIRCHGVEAAYHAACVIRAHSSRVLRSSAASLFFARPEQAIGYVLPHARAERGLQCLPRVLLRILDRIADRQPVRDGRSDRGSERASGAVIRARQPLPAIAAQHTFLPVERVHDLRRVLVRAGDEDILAAARDEPLRAFGEIGIVFLVAVVGGEPSRFEAVRRDDGGLRDEQLAYRDDHFLGCELVTPSGREHGIEHERDLGVVRHDFRDCRDRLDTAEHADLECGDRHVFQNAPRLIGDPLGVDGAHVVDARRVLDRDRRDHRKRMAAHARERHDVRLQACASAWVGCGEHEDDGRKIGHSRGGSAHLAFK